MCFGIERGRKKRASLGLRPLLLKFRSKPIVPRRSEAAKEGLVRGTWVMGAKPRGKRLPIK